jgi:hypothetical protein
VLSAVDATTYKQRFVQFVTKVVVPETPPLSNLSTDKKTPAADDEEWISL